MTLSRVRKFARITRFVANIGTVMLRSPDQIGTTKNLLFMPEQKQILRHGKSGHRMTPMGGSFGLSGFLAVHALHYDRAPPTAILDACSSAPSATATWR